MIDNITVPVEIAISVGIITVELITNSIKHAFPGNRAGTITLSLKKKNAGAVIEVKDDGTGIPEGFDISSSDSLGLMLVNTQVQQIDGNFKITSENGTRSVLDFPIEGNNFD